MVNFGNHARTGQMRSFNTNHEAETNYAEKTAVLTPNASFVELEAFNVEELLLCG